MTKAERIQAALQGRIPDKIPFIINVMRQEVQEGILGRKIDAPTYTGMNNAGWLGGVEETALVEPSLTVVPEVAQKIGLDAIGIQVLPPLFVKWVEKDGTACISDGCIDSAQALARIRMPDPDDEKLMASISEMIRKYKGDFAMGARIRLGISPSILSMGMQNIVNFYAEEDDTLSKTIEMFTDWSRRMNKNLSELDFDFFWAFDDIAFTSSLLISPQMFREFFKENVKKAASAIGKPWIYHSDGNFKLLLDDVIDIGACGIHPIEKGSMDTRWLKENYGDKLCLVGNVDINYILKDAPLEEVDQEVKNCVDLLGPGGRYIISDSNSIPEWCSAANVIEMGKAVEKYRYIYT